MDYIGDDWLTLKAISGTMIAIISAVATDAHALDFTRLMPSAPVKTQNSIGTNRKLG